MNTFAMNSVASDATGKNQIRRWIEELTDYTPQQIEEILEKMEACQTKRA